MAAPCLQYARAPSGTIHPRSNCMIARMNGKRNLMMLGLGVGGGSSTSKRRVGLVSCSGRGIEDFIGGDLAKFDLGRWLADVEEHKALAIYTPHEGGYEGRYLNRLRYQGYYFLDLSARGLGDPETTLTKVHPVCPPDAKGLVVWIIEAKVIPSCGFVYQLLCWHHFSY